MNAGIVTNTLERVKVPRLVSKDIQLKFCFTDQPIPHSTRSFHIVGERERERERENYKL